MKIIKVPFGKFYYDKFIKPIREKKDFILLILDTLNILHMGNSPEDIRGKLIIKIGKMSRLFYCLDDKYYSIVFPFSLEETDEGVYRVYDAVQDMEIDNRVVSLMRNITEKINFQDVVIEDMLECVLFDGYEEGYSSHEVEKCWKILFRLLFDELGYIRYDYDEEHQNGDLHPLNHLDINYSSKCTYKLGLKRRIRIEEFTDLLDVETECRFVV